MKRFAIIFIVFTLASIYQIGCDSIPGLGQKEAPPMAPPGMTQLGQPIPPASLQPGAIPGQPMPQAVPQPGMPTPVQPFPQPGVAPPPGQPFPQPGVAPPPPGQPFPQPGVAPPPPGQPLPQPGAVPTAPQAITPPTPTGDALTDKLNTKKFAIATNFTATSALLKQILGKNKKQSYQVQLPGPPYCHTYIAVGDDKIKNIDLLVASPSNMTEASDETKESTATIHNHCPTVAGSYTLTVTMPQSSGEFAVQVFSK